LGLGVERIVSGVVRVVERVLASGAPLDRASIRRAARRIARVEAPLLPNAESLAVDALVGFGPLEPLLADPSVSDVLVNAPDDVWIERHGRLEHTDVAFPSPEAVVAAVERALLPLGLRLDRASPAVDARLSDGSRLHAVIPPAAVDGPVVAIRRFVASALTLDDLRAIGSVDDAGATALEGLVRDRVSVLVSGSTGSGKTTLLNVLSAEIPDDERVVTVEEAAELRLGGHVVRLEARVPNAEGAGEITVRQLVRQALRMRPDRIVVGEVRGPEALDLVQAMATGHAGSMGTVHASGPDEALWRVETLAAMAGPIPHDALRAMLRGAIGALVHVERRSDRRVVASISRLDGELREVWSW
jgi:pilus assembly protein CpaF